MCVWASMCGAPCQVEGINHVATAHNMQGLRIFSQAMLSEKSLWSKMIGCGQLFASPTSRKPLCHLESTHLVSCSTSKFGLATAHLRHACFPSSSSSSCWMWLPHTPPLLPATKCLSVCRATGGRKREHFYHFETLPNLWALRLSGRATLIRAAIYHGGKICGLRRETIGRSTRRDEKEDREVR